MPLFKGLPSSIESLIEPLHILQCFCHSLVESDLSLYQFDLH